MDRAISSIDEEICDFLIEKCDGNISVCLQYFHLLVIKGYVTITARNEAVMTEDLEECRMSKDFSQIPVPVSIYKRRLRNLDAFINKANKIENYEQKKVYTKGILILKVAAVIGEEFGSESIVAMTQLKEERKGMLHIVLKELERNDLIEIMDDSDLEDIRCRFKKSFLRETIYQIMIFKGQKQTLHKNLAEYMLSKPLFSYW